MHFSFTILRILKYLAIQIEKKKLIFRFVGIFEYIILLILTCAGTRKG